MPARTARGPTDPTRRDRIAAAAWQVVLDRGVPALSHRAVAETAGVPLGSTTYHFAGLDDLLVTATEQAVEEYRRDLDAWSEGIERDGTDLVDALCDMVGTALGPDRHRTTVSYDLYVTALRRPAVVDAARTWAFVTRAALARHVEARAARAITALLDGVLLDALVHDDALPDDDLRAILRAILTA